eukprot:TRINITY_DN15680_c0_g1_i1.p1 TRINITY_DN15680_c0_g1~~TRINITY_DN15680_c0_g1_i1.p1  ORF type:complete len:194 (-),score=37.68 TRINITY_DN15680_c0_g1_i1:145-726(-)
MATVHNSNMTYHPRHCLDEDSPPGSSVADDCGGYGSDQGSSSDETLDELLNACSTRLYPKGLGIALDSQTGNPLFAPSSSSKHINSNGAEYDTNTSSDDDVGPERSVPSSPPPYNHNTTPALPLPSQYTNAAPVTSPVAATPTPTPSSDSSAPTISTEDGNVSSSLLAAAAADPDDILTTPQVAVSASVPHEV